MHHHHVLLKVNVQLLTPFDLKVQKYINKFHQNIFIGAGAPFYLQSHNIKLYNYACLEGATRGSSLHTHLLLS